MKSFKQYLLESQATLMAAHLGLTSFGYGRYGSNGHVTHISKMGKLVPISKVKDIETLKGGQLKHLEHADDEVFNNGHLGTINVVDHINALRHGDDRVKISQKIDGSPSVVFGTHPDTGHFFVASKSAFNKDPKINYSDEDIDRNHGHAPGLASKLKALLHHGPKLGVNGIVQGDLLYTDEDKTEKDGKISFKPNTIRYSIDKNHPEGQKVAQSKIGVAIHTQYDHSGKAVLNPEIGVQSHPDVYNMPVSVDSGKMKFDNNKLKQHASEIGKLTKHMSQAGWNAVTHEKAVPFVKTYINSKVRAGEENLNTDELVSHVNDKYQKEIDKVKTDKSKAAKSAERDEIVSHIRTNSHHFDTAFAIQSHINAAKHHVISTLDKNQTFDHHYADGTPAAPEGYVSISHHGPLKLVNRQEFSRANFQMSANR